MPRPAAKRDRDALIKATQENRAEPDKTKLEKLEAAIDAMRNSRIESGRKQAKRNAN